MDQHKSQDAEITLKQSRIHEEWVRNYRTPENERFYRMAFAMILRSFNAPPGALIVDAGCGNCSKTKILVDLGYRVLATDLSESALEMARKDLRGTAYEERVELQQQNLTAMTLADESVDYLICWGVLMHIPEVDKAVAELSRVIKPGGYVAISEANMHSLQSWAIRSLKKILGRERAEVSRVPAGVENWEETPEGRLLTRQAHVGWLTKEFEKHGLERQKRVAGQFTELYWLVKIGAVKKLIHLFNHLWFQLITYPGPAFGNILICKKMVR